MRTIHQSLLNRHGMNSFDNHVIPLIRNEHDDRITFYVRAGAGMAPCAASARSARMRL
jgi:hypothetical protein